MFDCPFLSLPLVLTKSCPDLWNISLNFCLLLSVLLPFFQSRPDIINKDSELPSRNRESLLFASLIPSPQLSSSVPSSQTDLKGFLWLTCLHSSLLWFPKALKGVGAGNRSLEVHPTARPALTPTPLLVPGAVSLGNETGPPTTTPASTILRCTSSKAATRSSSHSTRYHRQGWLQPSWEGCTAEKGLGQVVTLREGEGRASPSQSYLLFHIN